MNTRFPVALATSCLALASVARANDDDEKKRIQELEKQIQELRATVQQLQSQQASAPTAMDLDRAIADLSSRIEARQGVAAAKGGVNVVAPDVRSIKLTFEDRVRGEVSLNRTFGARKFDPLNPVPLATSVSPFSPNGTVNGSIIGGSGANAMLDDANRVLNRFRMNVNADINEKLAAFVQIQYSTLFGSSSSSPGAAAGGSLLPNAPITDTIAPVPPYPTDPSQTAANASALGFRQAYVVFKSLGDSTADLMVGRFNLNLGDGRLLSEADWDNVGRGFDGLRLDWSQDQIAFAAFAASVVEGGLDFTASDAAVYGGWISMSPTDGFKLQPYTIFVDNNSTSAPLMVGKPWTLGVLGDFAVEDTGVRLYGDAAMQQDTERPNTPIQGGKNVGFGQAYMLMAGLQFTSNMDEMKEYKPSVGVEYGYATKYFNDLYGARHGLYGASDVVTTLNNLQYWKFYASVEPREDMTARVSYFLHHLANNAGEGELGQPSMSKNLGQELDVEFMVKCAKHIDVAAGWAHYFTGNAMQEGAFVPGANYATVTFNPATGTGSYSAGERQDSDFFYLSLTVRF